MFAQVEVIHWTMFEKGANTSEGVRMRFSGAGQEPIEFAVFARGAYWKTAEKQSVYSVVWFNAGQRVEFRENILTGLAHEPLQTPDAARLVAAQQALGWALASEPQTMDEDHGWGNHTTRTVYVLKPVDHQGQADACISAALIDQLTAESRAYTRTLGTAPRLD